MFLWAAATKQFSRPTKPFLISTQNSGNGGWLLHSPTRTADSAGRKPETVKMRALNYFILAFAFLLAEPTLAGLVDTGLPAIGSFAYNGSPLITSEPAMVVAAR
jgi:hypothetical protein